MIRGLGRIVLYLVLGPFVGLIGASVAIGAGTLATTGSFRDFGGWEALVSPQILIVAYTIGALPALLTAIVGIVIERQVGGWRLWLWSALSGAVVSCILAWLMFGITPVSSGLQPVIFTVVFASAGGLAGLVCALVFDTPALLAGRR